MYNVGCSPKIKKLSSAKKMNEFIDTFYKKYPDRAAQYSDNWIDYKVTGVTGDVIMLASGIDVE